MDLIAGFKHTEIGVIPEDWNVTALSALAAKIIDGTHHTPTYTEFGVPFLRVTDIQTSEIEFSDLKFISKEEHSLLTQRCNPEKGDLLLSKNGTIGIPKVVTWDWEFSIFVSLALLKLRPKLLDSSFLYHFFKSSVLTEQIRLRSKQGTVTNLHLEEIREFLIPLPPTKVEQEVIAGALSDTDRLIESLERLITKKRQLKQATMQELLTGKRRLPGFRDEWEATTLGQLVTFLSGGTPSRSNNDYWTGNIPWISATSLRSFEIWRSDSNVTREAVATGSKMAPVGSSLLLVRGSALHNEILCGLVTKPVCFNQDVKALVPHPQVGRRFLTLFIKGMAESFLKLVSSAGNTAGVLDTKLLKAFAIKLPNLDEQAAIAAALSEMHAETEALKAKLSKARQIKQGMMQTLLTGKVRLV